MKHKIIFIFFFCIFSAGVHAQEIPDSLAISDTLEVPEGYMLADSVIYRAAATADTSLVGKNIFAEMPAKSKGDAADARIHQSEQLWNAMSEHIRGNSARTMSGYRVRIFFDNRRTARAESEATLKNFISRFHDVAAYRSYVNPYFKVTVGDFRTKSEAMRLLRRIKGEFPSAFIVKENISYPVVDKNMPVIADTVKILKPIAVEL